MNAISLITALAALVTAGCYALRLHALKREKAGAAAAGTGPRVWMLLVAGMSFFHAQAALVLQWATWTEMVMSVVWAGYSVQMWLNVRAKVVIPLRHGLPVRS